MADWHELSTQTARDARPPDGPGDPPYVAADGGAGGNEALDDPDAPPTMQRHSDSPNPQSPAPAADGGAGGNEALDDPDLPPTTPRSGDSLEPQVANAELPQTGDELPVPEPGTPVYRVWGRPEFPIPTEDPERPDLEGSGPWGRSWTPVDPASIPDIRSGLGLPDQNTGGFVSEGVLLDNGDVLVRPAQPLDGNPGGSPEFVLPDPENQVELRRVSGLNPNA